jgi:Amt family ammonium transporter
MSAVAATANGIDTGDSAWMLMSTALVMMMTVALGLFYAGLVRSKNSLNTFMMSIAALGAVTITWACIAYSLAFSGSGAAIGNLENAFLHGVTLEPRGGSTIPHLLYMAFEASFCIITAALVSGAIIERMRFGPFIVFICVWACVVYAPLAHWVWAGGWLADNGVLAWAGGVPVEMCSGFSALAAAIVVGARKDYGRQALLPHNSVYVLLGAGLLWFGWFGFNGGSAINAGAGASLSFVNTLLCPAATLVVWMLLDWWRNSRPTAIGAATAIIVGCVGITPAAGWISPTWAMLLGALAAFPSYAFIVYRPRTRLDETLDVLAAHGLAGMTGILFIGFFAQAAWSGVSDGGFYGNWSLLGWQAIAAIAAPVWAFCGTFVLLRAIEVVSPLRVTEREEALGLDVTQHGEEAYTSGEGAILLTPQDGIEIPMAVAQTT